MYYLCEKGDGNDAYFIDKDMPCPMSLHPTQGGCPFYSSVFNQAYYFKVIK